MIKEGECLSKTYINAHTKMLWRCKNNHSWKATYGHIHRGTWCPVCANKRRLSISIMRDVAKKRGGLCLSTTYINNVTSLQWQCSKEHRWWARPNNIKNGNWCPYCVGRRQTITDMRLIAELRGGKCLSKEFKGVENKLIWECSKGHVWNSIPSHIKKGHWCPSCAGNRKSTIDDMKKLAEERNGKCISTKYINTMTKLQWECKDGHRWEAIPNNILKGQWCPACREYRNERLCRLILQGMFELKFDKARPAWLRNHKGNLLELDGYNKSLRLAFEYQGNQHYTEIQFFNKNSDFNDRKKYDIQKRKLCKKNGVYLIEIPYTVKSEEISSYILKKLHKHNSVEQLIINKYPLIKPTEIYSNENLDNLKECASTREGKCLSNKYINATTKIWWECKKGHKWEALPDSVSRGSWCPRCAGNEKKSINEMKLIAHTRGGKCLSDKIINVKNNLLWQCSKGHEWYATPDSILNKNTWCAECYGNTKKNIADMQQLAKKREGKCLSSEYINTKTKLFWECKVEHRWEAIPSHIKRGHWCPVCAINNNRLTIEDMKKHATDKLGKCLSVKYVDNKTKLLWECARGHRWETVPANIRRGTWCPKCANKYTKV